MNTRPFVSNLSGFVLLLLCLAAATRSDRVEAESKVMPVKIGAVYNLSGSQASLGRPSLNGAILAVEQLNAHGGLLGRGLPFWLTASLFLFVSILAFRLLDREAVPRWRLALSSAVIAICAALVTSFVFEDLFLVRLP